MAENADEVLCYHPPTEWAFYLAVPPVGAVGDLPRQQPTEDVARLSVPALLVRVDLV